MVFKKNYKKKKKPVHFNIFLMKLPVFIGLFFFFFFLCKSYISFITNFKFIRFIGLIIQKPIWYGYDNYASFALKIVHIHFNVNIFCFHQFYENLIMTTFSLQFFLFFSIK